MSFINEKETRELKCVLTDEEMKNYSMALARKQQDLAQAELEKKAAASYHKEKLERLASEINTVSRNVVNGYEFRQVDCEWIYDWENGVKRLYRHDTGELVDSRAITPYERQQHLELEEAEDPEEGADKDPDTDPTMPTPTKTGKRRRPSATA